MQHLLTFPHLTFNVILPVLLFLHIHPFLVVTSPHSLAASCPQIQPLAGPLEGGTLVTIEGSNLGLKEEDVRGNVFIGDVPCHVHEYHVSVKIICRTSPVPGGGQNLKYPVSVTTPAGTTSSTVKFTYSVSILCC